ncbi:MAG: ribbon-helix-helix protein, CopG family [Iamia sp.]
MATTTIRVDVDTRDRLREIARAEGRPITEVTRQAVESFERSRRIAQARVDLARLRADPEAWADYLAEGDSLPVGDGITG